jgi:C1A family cysteine protease
MKLRAPTGSLASNLLHAGRLTAHQEGWEKMESSAAKHGLGWLRDYPDFRDYNIDKDEISDKQKAIGVTRTIKDNLSMLGVLDCPVSKLEPCVDLRQWCSPVEDQGKLGSCTANAAVGTIEYFERRAFGNYINGSRLFLYKVSRNLLGWAGDQGAFLRTTMAALVLFGIPPESFWPYEAENFDTEPSSFLYAFAQNYRAINYFRLDQPGVSPDELLCRIKIDLAAGLPSMFGFTVFSSIEQAEKNSGRIPFPLSGETIVGGHAVAAVGYDDNMIIKNLNPSAQETKGALLIRNSWGPGWGEDGYGWLPYDYVLNSLAVDWWSVIKSDWVDTKQFGLE